MVGSAIYATGIEEFEDGSRIGNQSETGNRLQRVRTIPIRIVQAYSAVPQQLELFLSLPSPFEVKGRATTASHTARQNGFE